MSRARKFQTCPRAYYFHYYGSWGGWKRNADPRVRELWILKKLTSRWAWAGTSVHETIAWALEQAKEKGDLPPIDETIERMQRSMRQEFRESRSGAWRFRRALGLVEHAYDEHVDDVAWRDNFEHARSCLINFLESPVLKEIQAVSPESWHPIDSLDSFTLDGFTTYVAPDFAFRDESGRLRIIDWKTGARRDSDLEQIRGYILFAMEKWGATISETLGELHYLSEPDVVRAEVTTEALEAFRQEAKASIEAMRSRLSHIEENVAEEGAFEAKATPSKCGRCNFRGVCEQSVA